MSGKNRVSITDKLAAEVMFSADRTCCVCRTEKLKVQIHHIDENPSNNSFENLAVICLHCHSDAHTSGAFVRRLTPELLALYNKSWREIVKLRLIPPQQTPSNVELAQETLLQASLDCHYWKVQFVYLLGSAPPSGKPGEFVDVWDAMMELWVPKYTDEAYKRFAPLFTSVIDEVNQRLDRLSAQYADTLPASFRVLILRSRRQLGAEKTVFLWLDPLLNATSTDQNGRNIFFYQRFVGVIRVLREITREADKLREQLAN